MKSFWKQFQTTLNTGSSNVRTVTLNEFFLLFGHNSQIKSGSTFDVAIITLYVYVCVCVILFSVIII